MIWTNTSNLPQPLVDAVMADEYDKVGDISASALGMPPRIRQLEKRHSSEIVEDVSDGIWKLIGNIGHKILERANTDNHLPEERLTARVGAYTISGKADLLGPDMTLDDYKFTSVFAVKDAKVEWENQLNVYAWLYRQHGFIVKRARIIAVLRDWSKMKAKREPDNYPPVGVVVREVPLWTYDQQEAFIRQRLNLHMLAEQVTDDELPMCTEEERWHKPDTWAVYKKQGAKRATRVFNTADAAGDFIMSWQQNGAYYEHRPGSDPRCESYCPVAAWCSHGKQYV